MTNPKQDPNLTGELGDEQLAGVTGGTLNPDVTILPTPVTAPPVPVPYPISGDSGGAPKPPKTTVGF
jgi:hypothetical protein